MPSESVQGTGKLIEWLANDSAIVMRSRHLVTVFSPECAAVATSVNPNKLCHAELTLDEPPTKPRKEIYPMTTPCSTFDSRRPATTFMVFTNPLYALTLISLLSLFAFAAQADAQDNISNQLSRLSKLRGRAGHTRNATDKAKVAGSPSGFTEEVLYSFCSEVSNNICTDGNVPQSSLIEDASGNLYGTTALGGASLDTTTSGGTVFRVDNTGHEEVLYSFCSEGGSSCTDGDFPIGGLVQDSAGNLYGTTNSGGAVNFGTVFKVDSTGHETVLHSFCSAERCTDGYGPAAGLIQDAAGNLYGTTGGGGNLVANGGQGGGVVFKVDSAGNYTVLYTFCSKANCTDGAGPEGVLTQDAAGNLYGTTTEGGANTAANSGYGGGTAFELSSTGHLTVLYSFCSTVNCADGLEPESGLLQNAMGNLYGTTTSGGANNYGTVFELNGGGEKVLYSLCSDYDQTTGYCLDGGTPYAGVIQDSAGNLYGTASRGGANDGGVVFELNSGGEIVLYNFCSEVSGYECTDGEFPVADLFQDAAGNLYGTTLEGGANADSPGGGGTVFKLATGGGGGGTATVTLSSAPNPSFVDESVTFSAVVSGSGATPTGSVTFNEGKTVLGTVTLADGKVSLSTTFAEKGTASIVASYSGDATYKAANSKRLKQVVKQYTTGTALASSQNPSTYGQAVTFTATVSSAGPTPTGTVTFKDGSKTLGSASLSGGVAKITTSSLPVGTLTITADYGGDAASAKSTSAALKQVVDKAFSSTSIASSVNPSKVGQKVKFTATVTSPTATPTGTVTFMDGRTTLGTGNLAKGKASFSTSALSAGAHNITAVYEGTSDISGSTSEVLVQTVQ
jgi:uncharacterized repeat protein (TIGR03803 family)